MSRLLVRPSGKIPAVAEGEIPAKAVASYVSAAKRRILYPLQSASLSTVRIGLDSEDTAT
jgi:hypothetical protein